MSYTLNDFIKYASSNEDDEDTYPRSNCMTDAESKAKYDRLLATSRKLRGVGFYTSLAGSGLRHIAPEIAKSRARAEMSQSAKRRSFHRAHKNPNDLMVVTPGMAQTGQRLSRFGKGATLAGALMMGAGQASAGIAHRKRLNYLEHALREKNKEQEKTAASDPLGKKLYKSDSKLKAAIFGTYKKGPDKGANKFNVAYDKKRILNSWKNDVYKNDKTLDDKIERRHKEAYDDAFIEAAARPVALAVGTGAAIYGGKKLLDRYNKRQAEKKEESYYL